MTVRAGLSLLELVVALAFFGLVAGGVYGSVAATERAGRMHARRLEVAEAFRTTVAVLGAEVRYVDPAADLAVAPDSVALRAFRGTAIVCGEVGGDVRVRYRGLRDPDPAKDSVIVVGALGDGGPVALAASTSEAQGCAVLPGESLQRWTLGARYPVGTLLLLFESGSYHLATGAFRYRRGAGGRQPITGSVLDVGASGFAPVPTGAAASEEGLTLRLAASGWTDAASPGTEGGAPGIRRRLGVLNGAGNGVVPAKGGGRP